MASENMRRRNGITSAATQNHNFSFGIRTIGVLARIIRWLSHLVTEIRGAVADHRNWIDSDRARVLGTTFDVSGRFLAYAAYIALAYLAFNSVLDIRYGLAAGIYSIPEQVDGTRVALFYVLAGGLAGPIAIIVLGIGIGWLYNLTTATANWALPRFVQPCVHPSILFIVVAAFAVYHSPVTATVAKGYLYAKVTIEAASPQEAGSIKIFEIPSPPIPGIAEATIQEIPGDRELARLRSMFNSSQPCPKEGQGTDLTPQAEAERPEPGLAPRQDCQATTTTPHE